MALAPSASAPHARVVSSALATAATRAAASSRAALPTSRQLLAQPAPLPYSSAASQQSQTPSLTTVARRYAGRKPRFAQ